MRPGLRRGFGELIWASRTWFTNEKKQEKQVLKNQDWAHIEKSS